MIQAAAEYFDIVPRRGAATDSRVGTVTGRVFSPLRVTLLLITDGNTCLCFVTCPFYADSYPFSNLVRLRLQAVLSLTRAQIAVFSSHNHSCVFLSRTWPFPDGFPQEHVTLSEGQLTREGRAFLRGVVQAAKRAQRRLVPVRVAWSVGHERRISYNRKGWRADASTYMIREEDRKSLGRDYNGDIDDEAPVVAFMDKSGRPVGFLAQFTCHPCTAYHPEEPIVFGDFPQVACEYLSAAWRGAPAAFLQGCAGETNSKGFLASIPPRKKVAWSTRLGRLLGRTYVAASRRLQPSTREDLAYAWQRVKLPFTPVPSAGSLRADLAEMHDFLRRCAAGDENTRTCVGLNFPAALSPKYRATLVAPCKQWTEWALRLHREGRRKEAPKHVEVEIGVFRIGDVGIVGLPVEPFLGIGRQIRQGSKLPLTIPCGYMNDNIAYVQDAPNLRHRDYSSSYYRYTRGFLPFKRPGGDLLARAAVKLLNKMT